QPRGVGCDARQAGQPAHRVVRRGPDPMLVALVEVLRLVAGHVDADRTVDLAALAGQAQIQRLPDLRRLPAPGDGLAEQHLLQHARTPAGGVLLVPGRPVARAHHATRADPAPGDADAAVNRLPERPAVVVQGQLDPRRLPPLVVHAQVVG